MRMPGRWLSALTKQWGASPVFTLPPELYLALQTGVVDGYLLIWDIINGLKLYEVSPYLVADDIASMAPGTTDTQRDMLYEIISWL